MVLNIVTAVVNNPDYIELQWKTLKKYIKCDYRYIVFNDAKDWPDYSNAGNAKMKEIIRDRCNLLGIECVDIPNESHKTQGCAAQRCASAMNFILDYQRKNGGQYLCLDSDMFPIADFNITQFSMYDLAVVHQTRHQQSYFWNGIYYFDMDKIKNQELLNWSSCPGYDVGGSMRNWLSMGDHSILWLSHVTGGMEVVMDLPESQKKNKALLYYLEHDPRGNTGGTPELYHRTFLHVSNGGLWHTPHNYRMFLDTAVMLNNALC